MLVPNRYPLKQSEAAVAWFACLAVAGSWGMGMGMGMLGRRHGENVGAETWAEIVSFGFDLTRN
jgi:hypothetical protein